MQVLPSTKDFRPCETARLDVILKRLQRRGFSQATVRPKQRLAFGLPQGA
jgi:hypothetical protein